ncbi:copper-binding protein (NosD) [Candidatus Methanophagaceae archaeon]|nr:copper-binding protein (NosD) [Methanophagales archaeon]
MWNSSDYNIITNNNASFNDYGIGLYHLSSNNTITNNNLISNSIGLVLDGFEGSPNNNQIRDNSITFSEYDGILLWDLQQSNNIINNNASNNNLGGIIVDNSTSQTISTNTANFNERGIVLYEASDIKLMNNAANTNKISGFDLINTTNNILLNNSACFNTHEGIYLSNSNLNNISYNNVSSNYFGISLYSSNDNNIISNIAESNYYFKVFKYSSTGNNFVNFTQDDIYNQTDIVRGVRLYVLEALTPSLQTAEDTTNATYDIIVENHGNMPDTFDLCLSNQGNPGIASLDKYSVYLGTGEISTNITSSEVEVPQANATISKINVETIKLNVSDTEPGFYRVKITAHSRNDNTVKGVIETWTIVPGVVDTIPTKSTITNSALIKSTITSSTIIESAIINSSISDSTITGALINNSGVVSTTLQDIILEDANVNNGVIARGNITIKGITYEIENETRILDLVIGSDYSDSNLVGIKNAKTLNVYAENSNTSFDISAKADYFAGSMQVQKSVIPPDGIPEFANNVGGYVYANASDNLVNSTGWVIVKVYYDPNELVGINESSLRLRYYNETANLPEWEDIPVSGINRIENYVWGNVSHYSVFAGEGKALLKSGVVTPKGPSTKSGGGGGGSAKDSDGDGFTDILEFKLGTDKNNPDSDGDGVNDYDDPYPLDPELPLQRLTSSPSVGLRVPTPSATPAVSPVHAPTATPMSTPASNSLTGLEVIFVIFIAISLYHARKCVR